MAKKKPYVRPDGLMEKKLTINGKRYVFRGKTEAEIIRKIAAFQEKVEKGHTFEEMANEWWAYKESRLSPNTVGGYRTAMVRAIDRFGEMPIKDITATQVRGWLDSLARRGYARKTVANHLIVAAGVFSWACENHNLSANPAVLVHIPDGLPKEKRKMPLCSEIEIIKQHKDTKDGLLFYFLMYTGLRRGEALALQWKDIDVKSALIHVRRSLYFADSNVGRFKEPKTEAGKRDVIYLDRLQDVLEKYRGADENFVFGGTAPMTHKSFDCLVKRYHKQTGLTVTPHQLRHAFATLCFEAGIPEKTAQGLLGHAQLSTTMDIYAELRAKKLMEAAHALNACEL